MSRDKWVDFFTGARIPLGAAKQYAKAFHDNRISTDMLMDLNKDYLRDMGITILGDIIAILKHAKQVQAQLTTESDRKATPPPPSSPKVTKPTAESTTSTKAGGGQRKVTLASGDDKDPRPEGQKPEAGIGKATAGSAAARSSSKVKQRLGPPNTIKFGDQSRPEKKAPAATPAQTSTGGSGDIFNRLGPENISEADRPALAFPANTGGGGGGTRIVIDNRKPEPGPRTEKAGRNLPSSGSLAHGGGGGGGGRVVIDRHASPPPPRSSAGQRQTSGGQTSQRQTSADNKKYVLISKLSDGTKIQEVLKPNDPRIQQLGVTKKLVVPSGSLKRSVSSPAMARKVVGSPPGGSSHSGSSSTTKRTRITFDKNDSDSETGRDNVMREPRSSLQARLGPKVAPSGSSRGQGSGGGGGNGPESGPVARARIADSSAKAVKRTRITFDSDAADSATAAKQRVSLTSPSGRQTVTSGMRSSGAGYGNQEPARKRIQWTKEDDKRLKEEGSDHARHSNIQNRLGPKPRISF